MKTSIRINNLFLIVLVAILSVNNSEKTTIRSYFIEKDYFNVFKLGEFSIFDSLKKSLLYRIESYHVIGGKIELIDYSSKQVIGKLRNTLNLLIYEGNFSIVNSSSSNQWINGKIERIFHVFNEKYLIKWNGYSILMETKFASLTTTFEYEYHSGILAKIQKRPFSLIRANRYDLQISSNDLPDALYFFALAVKDQNNRGSARG